MKDCKNKDGLERQYLDCVRQVLDKSEMADEKIIIKSPLFNLSKLCSCSAKNGDFDYGRRENYNN